MCINDTWCIGQHRCASILITDAHATHITVGNSASDFISDWLCDMAVALASALSTLHTPC
jgi:hypothetical protein